MEFTHRIAHSHLRRPNEESLKDVAISSDGRIIASTNSSSVSLWDSQTGKLLRTLRGARGRYQSIALTNNWVVACRLYVPVSISNGGVEEGHGSSFIDVWRIDTGEQVHTLIPRSGVNKVVVSPDGRRFASSGGRRITLYDLSSGQIIHTFEPHNSVVDLLFHPDGKTLISAEEDGTIKFWSIP